jgi:hypothetical protein
MPPLHPKRFTRIVRAISTAIALQLTLAPVAPSVQAKLAGVYCPILLDARHDPDLMSRLESKSRMRKKKKLMPDGSASREVSIVTLLERKAGQMGGMDEQPDPAAGFVLKAGDPLLKPGMEPGVYWTNSGRYVTRTESITRGAQGGRRLGEKYELVMQYRAPDGTILHQQGGYADPDSSWGWDVRFEIQVDDHGREELVLTQGAMPLVDGKLPGIKAHNNMRARAVFKIDRVEDGRIYATYEGPILDYHPDKSGDWIQYETVKGPKGEPIHIVKSAHGYGENYIPDLKDPQRMWKDEYGYTVRIFDMVVQETHVRWPNGHVEKIPSRTRGIAYRMDPKNPSKRVPAGTKLPNGEPADHGIVIVSEELPTTGQPAKSTLRIQDRYMKDAEVLEVRTLNMDGTVTVQKNPKGPVRITLVEGFNMVPGIVRLPSGKEFHVGTFSASEYTWGGILDDGTKPGRYGSYVAFRERRAGPLGLFKVVTDKNGNDFHDFLEAFGELYGFGWGPGRPQAYQDEFGHWWMDVHAVDTDLLRKDLPKAGFPDTPEKFADGYRRQKIRVPIKWVEKNGMPAFEIDDPQVMSEIRQYLKKKAAEATRAKKRAA